MTALRFSAREVAILGAALVSFTHGSGALAGPRAQDLASIKAEYVLKSHVFSPAARARALRYISTASATADAMTREQFLLCVLRIAAFADNGHDTEHDVGDAWWPDARLPIRMLWFPSGWVVARADSAHADMLGARVLSIENLSPAEMFNRLREFWGGPDTSRRWNLEFLIENAGLLHAAGIAHHADRLTLQLALADGRRVTRTLAFVPRSELPSGQIGERVWSPAAWPGEAEKGWRAVDPQPTPLYLQDGARWFRVVRLPELEALFIQMRMHFDGPDESIADFRRTVDDAIVAFHPRHLIVDLRFDTGGNIDLTREWQRTLPAHVPGRVYILVGPYTFSAGIVAAAAFKHDAGERGRIVGDSVGDRLRFWSEGMDACMPNSHYCVHLTTGLWDLQHGCAGQADCYGDKYDARVSGLKPQLPAPLTPESWLAGVDPAMEAVKRDIGAGAAGAAPSRAKYVLR